MLAIPHNANVSNGLMFDTKTLKGGPLTKQYAEARTRGIEPLHEMTQMKGDSETHPKLSPEDEFADYGTWGKANLLGHGGADRRHAAGQLCALGAETRHEA